MLIVAAPSVPKPPASETAATRRAKETPPIPASMTGCSMPSMSVSRVRMAPHAAISLPTVTDPLVGVIMGSDSDLPVMQGAIDVLDEFGVSFEVRIISAHRTPEVMVDYAKRRGRSRHPGDHRRRRRCRAPARHDRLAHPAPRDRRAGTARSTSTASTPLLSIVQMPGGIPVATVAVGNAKNAGLLAIRILGTADDSLARRDGEVPSHARGDDLREGRRDPPTLHAVVGALLSLA